MHFLSKFFLIITWTALGIIIQGKFHPSKTIFVILMFVAATKELERLYRVMPALGCSTHTTQFIDIVCFWCVECVRSEMHIAIWTIIVRKFINTIEFFGTWQMKWLFTLSDPTTDAGSIFFAVRTMLKKHKIKNIRAIGFLNVNDEQILLKVECLPIFWLDELLSLCFLWKNWKCGCCHLKFRSGFHWLHLVVNWS